MDKKDDMSPKAQETPEAFKTGKVTSPDVDIFVNDEEILLVADLPGVAKEHLSISLENNTLTLEAAFTNNFQGTAQRKEFDSTDFHRIFTLPKGLDVEKTNAELKQGVLRLRLPKSAAGKPCQIKVTGD